MSLTLRTDIKQRRPGRSVASDLGIHCFRRLTCPYTKDKYGMLKDTSLFGSASIVMTDRWTAVRTVTYFSRTRDNVPMVHERVSPEKTHRPCSVRAFAERFMNGQCSMVSTKWSRIRRCAIWPVLAGRSCQTVHLQLQFTDFSRTGPYIGNCARPNDRSPTLNQSLRGRF